MSSGTTEQVIEDIINQILQLTQTVIGFDDKVKNEVLALNVEIGRDSCGVHD